MLRVLRCHGLSDAPLQNIYRATVIARLTYAASAWRGFTKASDRQRINSVIDRARRLGYCARTFMNCVTLRTMNCSAKLLNCQIMFYTNCCHHYPPHHNNTTSATARTHYSYTSTQHMSDCSFLTRMLYKNIY